MSKKRNSKEARVDIKSNLELYAHNRIDNLQDKFDILKEKVTTNTTTLDNMQQAKTDSFMDDRLKYMQCAIYLSILIGLVSFFKESILALLFPTP